MTKTRIFCLVCFWLALLTSSFGQSESVVESCTLKIDKLVLNARMKLGCRYVWGASGPQEFDCSGLVQYVFREVGIDISRTTSTQCKDGERVFLTNIQKGDIVFFVGQKENGIQITHVGIAISDFKDGNFKFIHASSANKCVCISQYTDTNFQKRYGGARRIINCDR